MCTIYTLLLIELGIIGSRIWRLFIRFYIRASFSATTKKRRAIHLVIHCERSLILCLVVWCLCNRMRKRRIGETIDKCWFAAVICAGLFQFWHGFRVLSVHNIRTWAHFFSGISHNYIWKSYTFILDDEKKEQKKIVSV